MSSVNEIFHRTESESWHRHVLIAKFVNDGIFSVQTQKLFSRQLILQAVLEAFFTVEFIKKYLQISLSCVMTCFIITEKLKRIASSP